MTDVIVVGSGASAVSAAYPLCEAGLSVRMLDFGNRDEKYRHLIPSSDFIGIRRSDEGQHRYFLGDNFEGIPLGDVRVGGSLTPPRQFVVADAPKLLPADTNGFSLSESLALGGLGSGWGAGVLPLREEDFEDMPVSLKDIQPHYKIVGQRIGMSGGDDDLRSIFCDYGPLMPPLDVDSNAETILKRYARNRKRLNSSGVFMGRTPLAVLTRPHRGRGAHQYHDMDYWADTDDSVYRPHITLGELQRFENFTYTDNRLVLSFREAKEGHVVVTAASRDLQEREDYSARAVVLSAGALGSARIVLRSFEKYGTRLPILTNMYAFIPSVNLNMLGSVPRDRRSSHAQVTLLYFRDSSGRYPVLSNFFSYRSLLTFKLLREAPLPLRECRSIMSSLLNVFAIVTVFHRDVPSPSKYCTLHKSSGEGPDRLEVQYRPSGEEIRGFRRDENAIKGVYRRLGCWPIKVIHLPAGSSIHYSGTLPMSRDEKELTCDADGRLFGTRSVYVADGSVVSPLPSTVPTLTYMAIADLVGTTLARRLGNGKS